MKRIVCLLLSIVVLLYAFYGMHTSVYGAKADMKDVLAKFGEFYYKVLSDGTASIT